MLIACLTFFFDSSNSRSLQLVLLLKKKKQTLIIKKRSIELCKEEKIQSDRISHALFFAIQGHID